MRTTTKNKFKEFIIESIDFEGSSKEKINYFFECYNSEFNHEYNVKAYPNHQERLKNYLLGIPSCINIPFYNWDILNLYKEQNNVNELTGKKENGILKNYWNKVAFTLIQAQNKLNK